MSGPAILLGSIADSFSRRPWRPRGSVWILEFGRRPVLMWGAIAEEDYR